MSDQATTSPTTEAPKKVQKPRKEGDTPIGRMSLAEVDAKLVECERAIKAHSETVKGKLTTGGAIPPAALRELSKANSTKGKLTMRRLSLLVETGDAAAMDLIEKLLKLKPAKT
jgi:hypothetical protein